VVIKPVIAQFFKTKEIALVNFKPKGGASAATPTDLLRSEVKLLKYLENNFVVKIVFSGVPTKARDSLTLWTFSVVRKT
jgi:hypothetical protein